MKVMSLIKKAEKRKKKNGSKSRPFISVQSKDDIRSEPHKHLLKSPKHITRNQYHHVVASKTHNHEVIEEEKSLTAKKSNAIRNAKQPSTSRLSPSKL